MGRFAVTDPLPYALACQRAYQDPPTHTFGPVVRVLETHVAGRPALVVPGTRPDHVADDLADLDVGPIDVGVKTLVHAGFWRCASLAFPEAVHYTLMAGPLDLTGHSLGAAIAVDLATLLVMAGLPPRRVVGFGCPRTAIGTWQADLLRRAEIDVILYRHAADPVPLVPAHADLCPGLDRVLRWCLPAVGDWHHAAPLTQIGPDGVPDVEDHAMAAYIAALQTIPAARSLPDGLRPHGPFAKG